MYDHTMQILVFSSAIIMATATAPAAAMCPKKCRSCHSNVTDCTQMGLINPPKDFDVNTKKINMYRNDIRVLGKGSFRPLGKVEVLKINANKIRVVKKNAFLSLPKLMTLDLSNNHIARIYSKSFDGLHNLKTLTLASNRIATMTGILDVIPSLFQLNLGTNRIRIIHAKTFHKNINLHFLDLRHNNIIKIHEDAFKNLKYLRYLFLNNNPLASIPTLQMSSSILQIIDFSHCKLKKVPQGIPFSVSDLRLSHNNINEIRKRDLENITNLRMLAINNNNITRVAFMAFSKLKKLQEIWLRHNKLIYIPRGLPDNLIKLYMGSNQVANIERVLFSTTSRLEYLTVENNRVGIITPGGLSRLHYLKYLNLQGNELTVLSKGMFANLRNVSTLTLSNNPITQIASGAFENMDNLTSMYMSYVPTTKAFSLGDNFLTAMPHLVRLGLMGSQSLVENLLLIIDDTPVMRNLTEINLSFNDIQTLPPSLRKLFPNIQALSIDGNSLVCDHRLLWLAKWMNETDVKFFSYEEPQCEEPFESKGRLLKDIPLKDFVRLESAPRASVGEEVREVEQPEVAALHNQPKLATDTAKKVVQEKVRKKLKGGQTVLSSAKQKAKADRGKTALSPAKQIAKVERGKTALSPAKQIAKAERGKTTLSPAKQIAKAERGKTVLSPAKQIAKAERGKTALSPAKQIAKAGNPTTTTMLAATSKPQPTEQNLRKFRVGKKPQGSNKKDLHKDRKRRKKRGHRTGEERKRRRRGKGRKGRKGRKEQDRRNRNRKRNRNRRKNRKRQRSRSQTSRSGVVASA